MAPAPLPPDFSLSPCYPQSNWSPLVLVPEWVGLCTLLAPVGLSKNLSCEAGSLSCCRPNPHGHFQSEVRGFISPRWSPGLRGMLHSPPFRPGLSVRWGRGVLPAALPAPFSATLSPALSAYLRECGAAGSASGQTACPVGPTLCQSRSCHSHVSPPLPSCPSPSLLLVWMNVYFLFPWCQTSLPFDFLSVLVVQGGAVCLPTPPSWFSL